MSSKIKARDLIQDWPKGRSTSGPPVKYSRNPYPPYQLCKSEGISQHQWTFTDIDDLSNVLAALPFPVDTEVMRSMWLLGLKLYRRGINVTRIDSYSNAVDIMGDAITVKLHVPEFEHYSLAQRIEYSSGGKLKVS